MDKLITQLASEAATAIINGEIICIQSLISSEQSIQDNVWPFITHVNELLQTTEMTEDSRSAYSTLLALTAADSNPKELVYAYLESCEAFRNSNLFCEIVPFVTKALLCIPEKQRSIALVCETLYSHIQACPWHQLDYQLVEEDAGIGKRSPKLTVNDRNDETEILVRMARSLVKDFLLPTVGVCTNSTAVDREALSDFSVKLAHYPLLYMLDGSTLEMTVHTLQCLYPSITSLLFKTTSEDVTVFEADSLISDPLHHSKITDACFMPGYANILYAVLYKGLASCSVPAIYSPQFKLRTFLSICRSMYIRCSNPVVAVKATRLLERIFSDVGCGTLTHGLLEDEAIKQAVTFICWCMQHSELLLTRQSAARILPLLCSRFHLKGRYQILLVMLEKEKSPEMLSYLYTLIKDFVHESWHYPNKDDNVYATNLIAKVFQVPEGGSGNLISDLNKISSALNLARYLVSRDKRRTTPYTKTMRRHIEGYIKPIGECIELELTALQQKLNLMETGTYELPDICVDVGGTKLDYNIDLEKQATLDAICRIQVVLHVHACLAESLCL